MADQSNDAYRLMPTGHNETVILSKTRKPGEKYKVQVRNTVDPFDELVVDAWIENTDGDEYFVFEDGRLGHTVRLTINEAKRVILRKK